MPAAYDSYNYPQYWEDRQYEHLAEVVAISQFLLKIPKISCILDIGAGFGRLTPNYIHRAAKIILTDPSAKLLKIARKKIQKDYADNKKKIIYIHSKIQNLPEKVKKGSVDLVFLIRVLHHLEDIDQSFSIIEKLINKNGYFILEFANKQHTKALISEFIKGNLTYLLDIFPKNVSKKKKSKYLPFVNYHPDVINEKLKAHGFKILDVRSVSNIRNPFVKRILPLDFLIYLEKYLQKPLSRLYFGPSLFILSQKK